MLPETCWRLLRVLLLEQAQHDTADVWFGEVPLAELARRARLTYATARWALARLRQAGLVGTRRTKQVYWHYWPATKSFKKHMWTRRNALAEHLFAVRGVIVRQAVAVPRDVWSRYIDQVRAHGRAKARVAAHMPDEVWPTCESWVAFCAAPTPPKTPPSFPGFPSRALSLGTQSSRSISSSKKNTSSDQSSLPRAAPEALRAKSSWVGYELARSNTSPNPSATFDNLSFDESLDDPDVDPTRGALVARAVLRMQRELAAGAKGPCPSRICDPNPKPIDTTWSTIQPQMGAHTRVLRVINAFRTAVKVTYDGFRWPHYLTGEVTPAMKHYDAILAFTHELERHDLSPEKWAIWRLRWFRKQAQMKFQHRPPPMHLVMNAKACKQRGRWAYSDMAQEFLPVFIADPRIIEQDRRNREAANRWAGRDPFVGMDRSYAKKRAGEIRSGFADPLDDDVWPSSRLEPLRGSTKSSSRRTSTSSNPVPANLNLSLDWMDDLAVELKRR